MGPLFRTFPRLLLGALLVCSLAACETKQELQTRMDDLAGEYRLVSMSFGSSNQIDLIPREELNVIANARVFGEGREWIFEYTLPIMTRIPLPDGSSKYIFHYHQVRQPIIWDQQLGGYFFYRLEESDLSGCGLDPSFVTMHIAGRTISFHCSTGRLYCSWIKSR